MKQREFRTFHGSFQGSSCSSQAYPSLQPGAAPEVCCYGAGWEIAAWWNMFDVNKNYVTHPVTDPSNKKGSDMMSYGSGHGSNFNNQRRDCLFVLKSSSYWVSISFWFSHSPKPTWSKANNVKFLKGSPLVLVGRFITLDAGVSSKGTSGPPRKKSSVSLMVRDISPGDSRYMNQSRTILFNLKDPKNRTFASKLLAGGPQSQASSG